MILSSKIKNISKQYTYLIMSLVVIIIGGIIFSFLNPSTIADEEVHISQIKKNYEGELKLSTFITNIPGYHYTLAYIGKVVNPIFNFDEHPKRRDVRLFQLSIALLFPIVIFLLIKELKQKKQLVLILTLLPIISIYFFVVYTDILALTLFLFAFLFHLKKRYDLAGLFMLLDMTIRQDHVIWLGFLLILLLYQIYQDRKKIDVAFVKSIFGDGISYFMALILFMMFYHFNGGVAIGDSSAHPSMNFELGNIYLFFVIFTVIFLPTVLFEFKKIVQFFRKYFIISGICIIVGYFIFTNTFIVDHPYNLLISEVFLHNVIARAIMNNALIELVAYILIIISVGYLIVKPFIDKKYILIIPCMLLALSLHWMIEFRYFMIPLVLFALTLEYDLRAAKSQIIYSGLMLVLLFYFLFTIDSLFL